MLETFDGFVRRGVVFSVLFHPKQMTVVSGSDDAEVRVWDLVDKSCVAVLKASLLLILTCCLCDPLLSSSSGTSRCAVQS